MNNNLERENQVLKAFLAAFFDKKERPLNSTELDLKLRRMLVNPEIKEVRANIHDLKKAYGDVWALKHKVIQRITKA